MSIATKMVGQTVNCPTCGTGTIVPEHDEPLDLPVAGPVTGQPVVQAAEPEPVAAESAGAEHGNPEHASVWFQEADATPAPDEEPGALDAAGNNPVAPAAAAMSDEQAGASLELAVSPAGAATSDESGGFSFGRRKLDTEEMDLTPMVDMTFLLLIFFMITASFSLQKSIEVPPPSPEQKGAAQTVHSLDELENNSVIVRIDDKNAIFVDDEQVVDRAKLAQALRSTMRTTNRQEVVVSASDSAFHETVIAVIDAANEVGMQKIRLATH